MAMSDNADMHSGRDAQAGREDAQSEREQIEMLLPWYVMGRLDHNDVARVEAYLLRDASLRQQVELIREEQAQARRGNEAIAGRSARNVDRLMKAVAARESTDRLPAVTRAPRQTAARPPAGSHLLDRIGALLEMLIAGAMRPGGIMRFAGVAAAFLIALQAGMLATMIAHQRAATYVPASGGPGEELGATADGAVALVGFAASATTSAAADLLAAHGMASVDGPSAGGLFTVRLGPKGMSDAHRDAKIQALKDRSDVVAYVILLR